LYYRAAVNVFIPIFVPSLFLRRSIFYMFYMIKSFVCVVFLELFSRLHQKYKINKTTPEMTAEHISNVYRGYFKYGTVNSKYVFTPFSFFHIFFTLFAPVFTFTAFESPLVLFSWWRNKIS
jgi:hypothetical protein